MAPVAPGVLLPDHPVARLGGAPEPLASVWAKGKALLVIGHGDCGTTRLTLPFVERMHRRRAPDTSVAAVLQETAEGAQGIVADLGLTLPIYLDPEPYPLSAAIGISGVPTLLLVSGAGRLIRSAEAFRRAELQAIAAELGIRGPFFEADEEARLPALRPG